MRFSARSASGDITDIVLQHWNNLIFSTRKEKTSVSSPYFAIDIEKH